MQYVQRVYSDAERRMEKRGMMERKEARYRRKMKVVLSKAWWGGSTNSEESEKKKERQR
jgi:hypothetical protein